jgi:hypothetical protein
MTRHQCFHGTCAPRNLPPLFHIVSRSNPLFSLSLYCTLFLSLSLYLSPTATPLSADGNSPVSPLSPTLYLPSSLTLPYALSLSLSHTHKGPVGHRLSQKSTVPLTAPPSHRVFFFFFFLILGFSYLIFSWLVMNLGVCLCMMENGYSYYPFLIFFLTSKCIFGLLYMYYRIFFCLCFYI